MATEEVVPLGEVSVTVVGPEVVAASKAKLKLAVDVSEILGTVEPRSRVTFRALAVAVAAIVVPDGMGLRRTLFRSATHKPKVLDAALPMYQVCRSVIATKLWEMIAPEVASGANKLSLVEESHEEASRPASPVPNVLHKGLAKLAESSQRIQAPGSSPAPTPLDPDIQEPAKQQPRA
jgi:hypothetical protein